MGIETALLIGSLAVSAYGTVKSMSAQKDAGKAQNRALQAQQKSDQLKQARERRDAMREARIRRAAVTQAGENQGAGGSSAAIGGAGSISSQLSSNLSFLDNQAMYSRQTSAALYQANKAQSSAQTYGAVAGFGAQMFSSAGGFGTLFEGMKSTPTTVNWNDGTTSVFRNK